MYTFIFSKNIYDSKPLFNNEQLRDDNRKKIVINSQAPDRKSNLQASNFGEDAVLEFRKSHKHFARSKNP